MRKPIQFRAFATATTLLLALAHATSLPANEGHGASATKKNFDSSPIAARTDLSAKALAPTGFEENKGQVRTTDDAAAPFVRYRLSQGNTQLFLLDNGISFQFDRIHYPEGYTELWAAAGQDPLKFLEMEALSGQVRTETYRMDMLLEGVVPDARVSTEGRSSDYTNYYTHGVLGVHTYDKVIYHDVWPGIDWVVYITEKGMKYDFVVRPGADLSLIRLRFEHHEELYLDVEGRLVHGNRMGRFTEEAPVSYQGSKAVSTRFLLEGNTLRFAVDEFDRSKALIIDPARIWGTYYGENELTHGRSCVVDGNGNVYLTGNTNSPSGIATTGGHQSSFGGGSQVDAFLAKFTPVGTRLWGTYYGGQGVDYGASCAVDAAGNVYLAGGSDTPTPGLIASDGHQNTLGSQGGMPGAYSDGMLVKFAPDGTRIWGTYYGGTEYEEGHSCAVDSDGNVYLAGLTASTSAIATSEGHQAAHGGGPVNGGLGSWDGFLVKFDSEGVRQWGSYYGGAGGDRGFSCAVDGNDNVHLVGWTTSSNAIATTDAHQTVFGGGEGDGFLAKFSSTGERLWSTYFGGGNEDLSHACAVDGSSNVYLAGNTSSLDAIADGGYQNTWGGGTGSPLPADAFLVKFNGSGTRLWGTYLGGAADDWGNACAVDGSGNVYLTGAATSTTIATADAYQPGHGGGYDALLAKFGSDGELHWATYYGGDGFDWGNACVVDGAGSPYLAGQTTTTTPGVMAADGHQDTYQAVSGWAGFLVKFQSDIPTVGIGALVGPYCSGNTLTVPYTTTSTFDAGNVFTAELSNATGSFAAPVTIGSVVATTSGTIACTIPLGTPAGNGYRIRVVSNSPLVVGLPNAVDLTVATAPNAGQSTSFEICATAAPANLFDLLVDADPGGSWTGPDGLPFGGVLDPSIHLNGLYTYTVPGTLPCADAQGFLAIAILSCTGIDDVESHMYGRWLGQDVDGSHVIDASGLSIDGWEAMDALGRQVHTATGQAQGHRVRIQLNAATGTYLLRLHTDQGVGVLRIHHAAQ